MTSTILYAFTLTFAARIGWICAGGLAEFIAQWWRGRE